MARSGSGSPNEGAEILRRREALGITKVALARAAGVTRETLAALEDGRGHRSDTLAKVRRALDELEKGSLGAAQREPEPGMIEFELADGFGIRVVVKGPVAEADALERSVARLVRDLRGKQGDEAGSQ